MSLLALAFVFMPSPAERGCRHAHRSRQLTCRSPLRRKRATCP